MYTEINKVSASDLAAVKGSSAGPDRGAVRPSPLLTVSGHSPARPDWLHGPLGKHGGCVPPPCKEGSPEVVGAAHPRAGLTGPESSPLWLPGNNIEEKSSLNLQRCPPPPHTHRQILQYLQLCTSDWLTRAWPSNPAFSWLTAAHTAELQLHLVVL